MKDKKIELSYNFPHTTKVVVINEMAPLTIGPAEGEEILLKLNLIGIEDEECDMEEYITVEANAEELRVELEDISDCLATRKSGVAGLELLIPVRYQIRLEGENFPYHVQNLDTEISIVMENGPVMIANCSGSLSVESENGPIKIHNYTGDIQVQIENGALSADGASGSELRAESENGAIKIRSASYERAMLRTENGMIYYEILPVDNAQIDVESENGKINLVMPKLWDFTLKAKTEYGMIKNKLDLPFSIEDEVYVVQNGTDGAQINLTTENGAIKIHYDEHLNLDFLRKKLDQLKASIASVESLEDKEKVRQLLDSIISYVDKGLAAIPEDKIKDAIKASVEKLNEAIDSINIDQAKDKIVSNVESITADITAEFKDFMQKFQTKYSGEQVKDFTYKFFDKVKSKGDWVDPDLGDKISATVMKTIRKVMPTAFDLKDKEKEDIAEQSRLKILQMLESGKITADEAEKLLKAIVKE